MKIISLLLLIFSQNAYSQWNHMSTFLNNCSKTRISCKAHLDAGCRTSGQYSIDPLNNGQKFKAVCDQVTDGGGWTVIIDESKSKEDILLNMSNFGSTSDITATAGKDSNGFYWGTNDHIVKTFSISNIVFNEISLTFTGFYNNPAYGLGGLSISNVSPQGTIWGSEVPGLVLRFNFNDAWEASVSQQLLAYNGGSATVVGDITRMNVIVTGGSSALRHINASGYNNSYPYSKRYINFLKVR